MNVYVRALSLGLALLLAGNGRAQSTLDLSVPDLLNLQQDSRKQIRPQGEQRTIPMDAPLDASDYLVGPGDLFALSIWSSAASTYQLSVTPEGFLLIPNVGALSVRDLTLEMTRARVIPLVRRKYLEAEISLDLLSPRKLSVQISGQVMNEGMIEMSSAQRVDHLISAANSLSPAQTTPGFYYYEIPRLRRDASERNILIRHRDGTFRRVDLVKYAITGKSIYNPYLREGDMVYVPQRKARDNNVRVLGGVMKPISVEYVEGDSLTDLVRMGFGLKALADTQNTILARETMTGGMDTLRVDLAAVLAGREANIAIQPGDRLFVPETPDTRAGDYISVEGEVVRPGRYPITPNATSLRDILRACGGFTANANPVASTLMRGRSSEVNIPEETAQEQMLSSRTTFEEADSGYYLTETTLRLRGEMVSVNFRKLFVEGDSTCDISLRNYDRLTVPPLQRSVYVFGQVLQPGHVPFVSGEDYRYYIDRANGYTVDARSSDVRVIKAGSRIWLDPGETEVEDGDLIWVPKDRYHSFSYYLTTAAQISTILGTVATLVILASTLK
jgi:protein involved in polysaccharide export with SLBB domain